MLFNYCNVSIILLYGITNNSQEIESNVDSYLFTKFLCMLACACPRKLFEKIANEHEKVCHH